MRFDWLKGLRKYLLGTCAALAFGAGSGRAGEAEELRGLLEQQQRQIEELKKRLDGQAVVADDKGGDMAAPKEGTGRIVVDDASIKKIIADYLKENPGAGMPPSVQTGYSTSTGFAIRSVNNPNYVKWDDESRIPFELRIRGRLQIPYYFYKVTDSWNHLANRRTYNTNTTNTVNATGNPWGTLGANSTGDFSQFEIKRMRLIFEGTVFDPNLRYHIQLDGGTRGIGNTATPFGPGVGNEAAGGGGQGVVDHAMRLFSAFVAYDWKPCCAEKGCGPDCPEGTYKYSPTVTFVAGKLKPFFAFEEILGSANEQFVEYSMVQWFFDAEDDNLMNWWGVQYKGMEDRLYAAAGLTNGSESQFPNLAMDHKPGINCGFWYDFGGAWNEARHRWDLFGDCLSDIDYSCKPVVRVGAAANMVWLDPREIDGSAEMGRFRVANTVPGAGTSISGLLNGGGVTNPANTGSFAVDSCDQYTFEAFIAGKYKGFSLMNDWFVRNYNNFDGTRNVGGVENPILYTSNITGPGGITRALFKRDNIIDMGTQVQAGYFVVPKRVELVGRYGWIHGKSGSLNGNGTFSTTTVPQFNANGTPAAPITVLRINKAFDVFQDSQEVAVGVNYFFRRQLLKWQTDFSVYEGGNPAAGGQSPAGYIPGVDGWLARTQIQLAF